MPYYNEEFKEQTVRKMMPPNALSVAQVSRDTGVSDATLYNWRNQFRHEGKAVPADPSNPENWSGKAGERFAGAAVFRTVAWLAHDAPFATVEHC